MGMLCNEFEGTKATQNLATAPLSLTTVPTALPNYQRDTWLLGVWIHFSQAVTETVTITRLSIYGSAYDTVIKTSALVAATDFEYKPDPFTPLQRGDSIKVQCTNAGTAGTAGCVIICGGR